MLARHALALMIFVSTSAAVSGCSVFRPALLGASNRNLVGEPAPALVGTEWVGADDAPATNQWRLLTFFKPL